MAKADKEKWDKRYRSDIGNQKPSEVLTEYASLATTGKALDLACGNGRNSIYLDKLGFTVDAVDISSVAISNLLQQAPSINGMCKDLDTFPIPQNNYELIINVNFLDRRLFDLIEGGLKPGGILLFESFTGNKTTNHCLGPNEVFHAFSSLHILFYQEKELVDSEKFERGVSLVAIKKA